MAISKAVLVVAVIVAFTATSGYGFTTIPGDLKQITASTNYLWGVNKHDDIFICKRPCNGNWRKINGKLMQVDADDHEVWGVSKQNYISDQLMAVVEIGHELVEACVTCQLQAMDMYGERTMQIKFSSVLSLAMDNGNMFMEHFAILMGDKRECMELIQQELSLHEMWMEVATGVTSPVDV